MGDARRRRLLRTPFPPVVVPKELPGHRKGCFLQVALESASCPCARETRIEARHAATVALLAAAAALGADSEADIDACYRIRALALDPRTGHVFNHADLTHIEDVLALYEKQRRAQVRAQLGIELPEIRDPHPACAHGCGVDDVCPHGTSD